MSQGNVSIDLSGLPQLTNDAFYKHYWTRERYLVLMGGGGSGKSVFAAQKLIYRMLCEPDHRFLVVRKVAGTLRNSCFALIKDVIVSWGLSRLFTFYESDLRIKSMNGGLIIMAGLDDVEKLKSIQRITGIWVEEASELTVQDFRQIDIRMRGDAKQYFQMVLTFNPTSATHWLKSEFFDKVNTNAVTVRTTYKDNRYLDEANKRVLEGFKGVDDYYYMVYCLGEWGVFGKTVYNARIVTDRLVALRERKPQAVGAFIYRTVNGVIDRESIKFSPDDKGPLNIYEQPKQGVPYVIGADVAEGGTNFSAASVRNNVNLVQVATWRGRLDTDLFAKQLFCLGVHYNEALIGVETNFDLHPVKELERLQYPRQYIRKHVDSASGRVSDKYGFQTTKLTRPLIISQHVALAREQIDTFNDKVLLEEMLTFVRNDDGRAEAQGGKFDDTVLADAITLEIRDQQSRRAVVVAKKEQELPHALQDDDDIQKEVNWAAWL